MQWPGCGWGGGGGWGAGRSGQARGRHGEDGNGARAELQEVLGKCCINLQAHRHVSRSKADTVNNR